MFVDLSYIHLYTTGRFRSLQFLKKTLAQQKEKQLVGDGEVRRKEQAIVHHGEKENVVN